ncbi:hypothetical protein ABG768_002589 [Culter alburnus]|uniref:C-type lectin domain-containing protein n=1 Tax=Culter alburnus TaxID=194366 RepID=A0AAW2A3M1_CULAL
MDMSGLVNDGMDKGSMMESEDRIEKTVDIYISAEAVRDMKHKKDIEDFDTQTSKTQTPQHTGSDSVKIRSSRAALVCLVLLCVLLLTAVIVLCVYIHTKSTNYTEEREQLLTNITNITKERDGLIFKNKNLMNKRDQLRNELLIRDGWIYYQSSFYYMPNETNNWNKSRGDCTGRGADLVIINNKEEQDFVKNMSGAAVVWIGLTDSDVENTWKWVDGSNMTSKFWASGEPGGGRTENCVMTAAMLILTNYPILVGWLDEACNKPHQWICEKSMSQLIMP